MDNDNGPSVQSVRFQSTNPRVHRLVDARQSSGRLVPVFPSLMSDGMKRAKEEAYIARMIERDRRF